jgi:hypothetical protein
MAVFAFVLAHLTEIGLAALGVLTVASIVVGMLPESAQKARVAGGLVKLMEFVSVVTHVDTKGTFKAPGRSAVQPAAPGDPGAEPR